MTARQLIESPQDYVTLGGRRTPGIAYVEGADLERRQRERNAFGAAGARVIDQGAQLIKFSVRLVMNTVEDLDAWDDFRTVLTLPATRQTRSIAVEHPLLADLGIATVLFRGRTQLAIAETGGYAVTMRFIEYRPPEDALAVPAQSSSRAPTDPYERAIAARTAQIAALEDADPWRPP